MAQLRTYQWYTRCPACNHRRPNRSSPSHPFSKSDAVSSCRPSTRAALSSTTTTSISHSTGWGVADIPPRPRLAHPNSVAITWLECVRAVSSCLTTITSLAALSLKILHLARLHISRIICSMVTSRATSPTHSYSFSSTKSANRLVKKSTNSWTREKY